MTKRNKYIIISGVGVLLAVVIIIAILINNNNKDTSEKEIADTENIFTEAVPESRHETENEAGESKETGKTESQNQETANGGVKETSKPTQAVNPTTSATKPSIKETQSQTQKQEEIVKTEPETKESYTQPITEPQEDHLVYNENGSLNLQESYHYFENHTFVEFIKLIEKSDEYKIFKEECLKNNTLIISTLGAQYIGGGQSKIYAKYLTFEITIQNKTTNEIFDKYVKFDGEKFVLE